MCFVPFADYLEDLVEDELDAGGTREAVCPEV